MYLIDEQHIVLFQIREQRSEISGPLKYRPGRLAQLHAHFVGNDVRKRRLAQARRPEKQHMVERLVSAAGGLDKDFELLPDTRLADIFLERTRTQSLLNGVLVGRGAFRSNDALRSAGPHQGVRVYGHGKCCLNPQ